jgi:hypothetical protein
MENKQYIVFAYWVNGELKGFRADTFNTITQDWAKIYKYSREQVDTVLNNVKSGCNRSGTAFMKTLTGSDKFMFANADPNDALDQITQTENTLREWGEFEIRVHPFLPLENEWDYPENWKIKAEIANLKEAIEVHKFKILEHEN